MVFKPGFPLLPTRSLLSIHPPRSCRNRRSIGTTMRWSAEQEAKGRPPCREIVPQLATPISNVWQVGGWLLPDAARFTANTGFSARRCWFSAVREASRPGAQSWMHMPVLGARRWSECAQLLESPVASTAERPPGGQLTGPPGEIHRAGEYRGAHAGVGGRRRTGEVLAKARQTCSPPPWP